MKKGAIILLSFMISLAIIAFFTTKNLSNSPPVNLEECHTLVYNGEGKANIVFFSSEETISSYKDSLFKVSPFKENPDAFNFYYINYKPQCEIYKGIALLCYSKETIKKAASCPNDYIIVVEEQPSNIRSSSYMNVMSLNKNSNVNVFPHEFGHAFANLADEYVPATVPKGSKNCQKSCDGFEGKGECVSGCSNSDYYRSVNSGIMRTLSSNVFGEFNEQLILSRIRKLSGITGNVIQNNINCENQQYYLITGEIVNNNINPLSRSLETGCVGENGAGPYSYNLILEDGQIMKTSDFNPEMIFTDEENNTEISGGPDTYTGSFLLRVPVIENSKKIEIVNENMKLEINLVDIGARPCEV